MKLISSLFGRRQVLIAFISSTIALAFGTVVKVFNLILKTGIAGASNGMVADERKPLRGIVVYFSATGSTAKVANAIYKGMKSVIACDVAPIKKVKPEDMVKYDVVAIGAPNWFHREPCNVKIFSNNMPRMDGKHCILFCTHGTQPVAIFWSMSRNMLKKGMTIIGWNDWYGDATHVLHGPQPYITHGHPDSIDLAEAEAFGRQMAENSMRIYAGEKALIPEIPTPQGGKSDNWSPNINDAGEIKHGGPPEGSLPEFDLLKCVYPRCTQCIDNCDANAIDFSIMTSAGSADSPLVLKEACMNCGAVCQKVCFYDAISYAGETTKHAIDTTKCIYPKCTLCVDECPMDAIDFSQNPPIVHDRCEGCDLCWCICPVDGASIITNLEKSQYLHIPPQFIPEEEVKKYNIQAPQGFIEQIKTPGEMFVRAAEEGGGLPKFRQLVPSDEVGVKGYPLFDPNVPRIVLKKENWPYQMD